jgi:hypothetical protein
LFKKGWYKLRVPPDKGIFRGKRGEFEGKRGEGMLIHPRRQLRARDRVPLWTPGPVVDATPPQLATTKQKKYLCM